MNIAAAIVAARKTYEELTKKKETRKKPNIDTKSKKKFVKTIESYY